MGLSAEYGPEGKPLPKCPRRIFMDGAPGGRLKVELLEEGCFENLQDTNDELFNYIDGYYNIRRLHSSLGYLSQINFEKQYYQANFHSSLSIISVRLKRPTSSHYHLAYKEHKIG